MKRFLILLPLAAAGILLSQCGTSGKAKGTKAPALSTYESNVQTVIMANCSPCHIPAKGGNKKPYDNFANVKSDIDEILRRIQLTPGTRGFMPMRGQKLSDSTIAVFKKWKEDGLAEK
ncbi:MAG: hypothetical protein J0H92_12475 [Sphingobacteriales bacterium]|mgnify:CR=1 FL=1|jgi:uncharacterized membrane protein|nr:hypothetical protein [Sphingobacteriales bacterium]NCT76247.1 hypothetical protein [Chitinophagaceae bacterium]OJW33835.1 MAG: hypothetical protein BGO54_11480 [Sphingobacteriales bacterium 46-32]